MAEDRGSDDEARGRRDDRPGGARHSRPQRADRPGVPDGGGRHRGSAPVRRASGDRAPAPRDTRRHAGGPRDSAFADRRGGSDRRAGQRPEAERPRNADRADEPALPDDLKPNELDRSARAELKTLSKENADEVARHLVMASRLIDSDVQLAHRHALAAGRRAGRIAIVRESVAITAYAVGDFALALRELRTFRRISGSDDQIGLMVDSERGMGRPERALELGRTVDREVLPVAAQVSLSIAMSGARLDLGDPAAALDELDRAPRDDARLYPWSPELYFAYAAVHEDLGHAGDAAAFAQRATRAGELLDSLGDEQDSVDVIVEELPPEPGPAPTPEGDRADEG